MDRKSPGEMPASLKIPQMLLAPALPPSVYQAVSPEPVTRTISLAGGIGNPSGDLVEPRPPARPRNRSRKRKAKGARPTPRNRCLIQVFIERMEPAVPSRLRKRSPPRTQHPNVPD